MSPFLVELIALNYRVREFRGVGGFRRIPVYCHSADGRTSTFAEWSEVPAYTERTLADFHANLDQAVSGGDYFGLAATCATFWMEMIAIHPFEDGNGRTTTEYLVAALRRNGLAIESLRGARNYFIVGDRATDLHCLTKLFLFALRENLASDARFRARSA